MTDPIKALERIANWGECDAKFRVDFGSNGERDYYRGLARSALAAYRASVDAVELPEPAAFWFRPISTEGEPMAAWKPVEPRNLHMNTVADTVRELLAYRCKDKPCYEVMPVHTATTVRRLIKEARDSGLSAAARDVLAERQRQISVEGWTPEHDDEHSAGEMAMAASCYAEDGPPPYGGDWRYIPNRWPLDPEWWKPSDHRRNLIKAGALILAEIERLDRAAAIRQLKD